MTVTINGSGTISGVSSLPTPLVNQPLTTPIVSTTIGVGGATPSASGSGITFPATQSASSNANTLDDYEEGTFTPAFSTTGFSGGYGNQQGIYTKVGNLVSCSINVRLTTLAAAGTGALTITGLPFSALNSGAIQWYVGSIGYVGGWAINTPRSTMISQGATSLRLWGSSVASYQTGQSSDIDFSCLSPNCDIWVFISYQTA